MKMSRFESLTDLNMCTCFCDKNKYAKQKGYLVCLPGILPVADHAVQLILSRRKDAAIP